MSRHRFYRVIESLLVTNLTNNLLSFIACSGALDSLTVTSVIVFPILQLGNKHEDTFRKINSHIESSASALCKDILHSQLSLGPHVFTVAMSTIADKLQTFWRSSHYNGIGENSGHREDVDKNRVLSTETQNRLKLRSQY